MHGLGNDFILIDGRHRPIRLTSDQVQRLSDRHTGIGCDQLLLLTPGPEMTVFNADGSMAQACGNATRCVADALMLENEVNEVSLTVADRQLVAWRDGDWITVDMGIPEFEWDRIPLSRAVDTQALPIDIPPLERPMAVNVGNPHAVFFLPPEGTSLDSLPLETIGTQMQDADLFPQGVNVSLAQRAALDEVRLRVWERGVGVTKACGSAACAATAVAFLKYQTPKTLTIVLDGGRLRVAWEQTLLMTGPSRIVYTGVLDPGFWDS